MSKANKSGDVWTAEDEAQFQALQARRTEVRGAQLAVLETVAGYVSNKAQAQTPALTKEKALAQGMLQHADELIDALAPFDSGTRPAPAKIIDAAEEAKAP